ncbi:hypothetical protein LIER_00125 [Lithospermum erythrorhizon]|uniref:RNase H type-1 domain-containing protein n=1 Tax=Lithospermum erythrorhizon TaxID=34254 RepID=A0AAV3NIR4_LITER
MCTDFTNLNKGCPKDYYPLLCLGRLVDGSVGHEVFDFLDASRGMPGLMMNTIFKDQVGKNMEIYVDEILVKSKKRGDHLIGIKAQVLADFIVENSTRTVDEVPSQERTLEEAPKWTVYVDGASNDKWVGAGILIQGVDGEQFEYVLRFSFKATNNVAEYEAIVAGLQMAKALDINRLKVRGDSKLVIEQVRGNCMVKNDTLKKYHANALLLTQWFEYVIFKHIPRTENEHADHLSRLATIYFDEMSGHVKVEIRKSPAYKEIAIKRVMEEEEYWRSPIVRFILTSELPSDRVEARKIKSRSYKFQMIQGKLYKRSYLGPLLFCVAKRNTDQVICEVHAGEICAHHI